MADATQDRDAVWAGLRATVITVLLADDRSTPEKVDAIMEAALRAQAAERPAGDGDALREAQAFVRQAARLSMPGDDDYTVPDDPDDEHYALAGLVAKARDILAASAPEAGPADAVREALEAYDSALAKCPVNNPPPGSRRLSGEDDCPRCGANGSGPCGLSYRAGADLAEAIRAALQPAQEG